MTKQQFNQLLLISVIALQLLLHHKDSSIVEARIDDAEFGVNDFSSQIVSPLFQSVSNNEERTGKSSNDDQQRNNFNRMTDNNNQMLNNNNNNDDMILQQNILLNQEDTTSDTSPSSKMQHQQQQRRESTTSQQAEQQQIEDPAAPITSFFLNENENFNSNADDNTAQTPQPNSNEVAAVSSKPLTTFTTMSDSQAIDPDTNGNTNNNNWYPVSETTTSKKSMKTQNDIADGGKSDSSTSNTGNQNHKKTATVIKSSNGDQQSTDQSIKKQHTQIKRNNGKLNTQQLERKIKSSTAPSSIINNGEDDLMLQTDLSVPLVNNDAEILTEKKKVADEMNLKDQSARQQKRQQHTNNDVFHHQRRRYGNDLYRLEEQHLPRLQSSSDKNVNSESHAFLHDRYHASTRRQQQHHERLSRRNNNHAAATSSVSEHHHRVSQRFQVAPSVVKQVQQSSRLRPGDHDRKQRILLGAMVRLCPYFRGLWYQQKNMINTLQREMAQEQELKKQIIRNERRILAEEKRQSKHEWLARGHLQQQQQQQKQHPRARGNSVNWKNELMALQNKRRQRSAQNSFDQRWKRNDNVERFHQNHQHIGATSDVEAVQQPQPLVNVIVEENKLDDQLPTRKVMLNDENSMNRRLRRKHRSGKVIVHHQRRNLRRNELQDHQIVNRRNKNNDHGSTTDLQDDDVFFF